MSKFKVGDKIRANRDLGDGEILKGEIYTCIGPSPLYPKNMIRVKGKLGKINGWNIVCFDLVEKIKHYKWFIRTPVSSFITEHYVEHDKIEEYVQKYLKINDYTIRKHEDFVEE